MGDGLLFKREGFRKDAWRLWTLRLKDNKTERGCEKSEKDNVQPLNGIPFPEKPPGSKQAEI